MPNMKKRNEAISTLDAQYVCTFRPEREGGYSVRCAAFPGLITNGKTLAEARTNAREALELCIEVYQDKGWPLPASDAEPRGPIKELIPVKLARV
jgi:predicted RNase H-like HicB family nuclease